MYNNNISSKYRGFFELYAIDERSDNDKENQHRWTGLKTPFGRRGSICSHLHWTWEYLHHGISWAIVQRLLIDAPKYEYDDKKEKSIELNDDNAEEICNLLNSYGRADR